MIKDEYEMWIKAREIFERKFEEQNPLVCQASPLYEYYMILAEVFRLGATFLKPNSLEYYSIGDIDLYISGIDEREEFLNELENSTDIANFIGLNNRSYKIMDQQHIDYRRRSIYKN